LIYAGVAVGLGVAAYYLQPLRRLKRARSKITLKYFNIDGLGEPIRLTLAMAGVAFEDYRFKERSEFLALKPSLTFGQVPAFFVDGTEMVQSLAVLRYIGKALDPSGTLYPSDPAVAQTCDALADQVKDMMTGRLVYRYKERFGFTEDVITPEVEAKVEAFWFKETLPRHLSFFEAALGRSCTPWLCGTASPTIADIFLATHLRAFELSCADKITLPANLSAYVARLYALPAIAAYKEKEKSFKK